MLGHSQNGPSDCNKNWNSSGLGSSYSVSSYPDTLHRGYGWGRMMDNDDFSWPIIAVFHNEAVHITKPMRDRKETQYQPTWH